MRFGAEYPRATGQVVEWLVWAALAARSGNRLHVFLPVRDTGIDGVVHCRGTTAFPDDEFAEYVVRDDAGGGMLAVQVKCVTVDAAGRAVDMVRFEPEGPPWPDPAAVVVIARNRDGRLADGCAVVPAADLGPLLRPAGEGRTGFEVRFEAGGRWTVGLDGLAERLRDLAARSR